MPKYITTVARYYNNRRLKAGDELVGVSPRDGNLMVKIGRAALVPDALAPSSFKIPPPPEPPVSAQPADSLATVRAEYERIVGKRSFHGWDEAELRKRIADHDSDGS